MLLLIIKLVVKKSDFNDIKTNGNSTVEDAIKKFGDLNRNWTRIMAYWKVI